MRWDRPFAEEKVALNRINSYAIRYRVNIENKEKQEFTCISIGKENDELEIKFLKSETEYEINVYWCNEDEESSPLFKKKCRTGKSKASFLMETASADKTQNPIIHHLKPVSMIEHQLEEKIEHGTVKYVDSIRILDMSKFFV